MIASLAIMAHPERRELAEALSSRLDAPVEWDRGAGEWDTGRRALLAYERSADWHVVVQDDAIVPERFTEAVELVLSHAVELSVGLYVGRCRPAGRLVTKTVLKAHESGSTWLEMPGPWWGVAVAFPTAWIPALVAWCDLSTHPFYDARLARWTKTNGMRCRYPIPSLADHDPDRPSLLDIGGGDRRAHDYIGERDPAAFDWSRAPVTVDLRGRILVPSEV